MHRDAYLGVDVCLNELRNPHTPKCPHGPTVLFERYCKSGENERFYACSASRDRKSCSFYHRADSKLSAEKRRTYEEINRLHSVNIHTHEYYQKRAGDFRKLPKSQRKVCLDCGELLLSESTSGHTGHQMMCNVDDEMLKAPTQLLQPLENNKTNAQYLFSNTCVKFLLETITRLGFKKVLCVGVPRIHEEIQNNPSSLLQSLLLDLDHRNYQFYPRHQYLRYNMFNHYLFDGEQATQTLSSFLQEDNGKVMVLVDPPFGGLAELIAFGLGEISTEWKRLNGKDSRDVPVMWFFPYFLESKVIEAVTDYHMLDYQVEYDNHHTFKKKAAGKPGGSKQGSVVRIFTNISPNTVVLPKDGYRYCKKCDRYVYKENRHCEKCQACTSKDGRTYRHCDKCGRCVKPNKVHCDKCDICNLPSHKCNVVKQTGCHICGSLNHKRKLCPKRNYENSVDQHTSADITLSFEKKKSVSKTKIISDNVTFSDDSQITKRTHGKYSNVPHVAELKGRSKRKRKIQTSEMKTKLKLMKHCQN